MFKFLSTILVVSVVAVSAQAEFKAGYVDMQKAVPATSAGKKALKSLKAEGQKKQKALKKKKADFDKKVKDFEKKKMVLSDKVRETKFKGLQKEEYELYQEMKKSEMQIRKKEMELTKPIIVKLQKIIEKVAKEKGLVMVFERSQNGVMWAKSELNITDEVIKKFNK